MADYIEREAAKEAAWENIINNVVEEPGMYGYLVHLVDKVFDAIPAADVRPNVTGRWIPPKFPYPWYKASCSCCGYEDPFSHGGCSEWNGVEWKAMNFCPNCGAKMMKG